MKVSQLMMISIGQLFHSQEAWSIIYQSGDHCVPRMDVEMGFTWHWADDVAHENNSP